MTLLARRRGAVLLASGVLIALGLALLHLADASALGRAALAAAAVVAGADVLRRALNGLRRRDATIELLVSVAVIGALVIGEVWEAAAVTFLFTLGAFLEARALTKTRASLSALLALLPDEAEVLRDGVRVRVAPEDVALGETVLVTPGGRVPVDGVITVGEAAVDESSVTGEALPVDRCPGDTVRTGTLSYGPLRVRATGVGADTTLARIVRRVEEAQEAKAPVQRFIERFARVYAPSILVLAVTVFAFTGDVRLALTLLVISCPGALVIATPVAIVAGIGRAARSGVLLKGGEVLERVAQLSAVVFDKTGTLTTGRPELTDVVGLGGAAEEEVLHLAASAEVGSEHPLARPILAAAPRALSLPERFESVRGLGVRAVVEGRDVVVGSVAMLRSAGVTPPSAALHAVAALEGDGRSAVLVAADGDVIGVLGLRDTLRDSAAPAIAALRRAGVRRVAMLTGDTARGAAPIAREAGVDEVHADALPETKLALIEALQREGEVIAMVGDGVNDAPALAAADVGIAMGAAGTRIALETAPVALLRDDLMALAEGLRIARATRRVIAQNVAIALATVAGLLAGVLAGEVHMALGMLVHQGSVLLVVANALRLTWGGGGAAPSSPRHPDRRRRTDGGTVVPAASLGGLHEHPTPRHAATIDPA